MKYELSSNLFKKYTTTTDNNNISNKARVKSNTNLTRTELDCISSYAPLCMLAFELTEFIFPTQMYVTYV